MNWQLVQGVSHLSPCDSFRARCQTLSLISGRNALMDGGQYVMSQYMMRWNHTITVTWFITEMMPKVSLHLSFCQTLGFQNPPWERELAKRHHDCIWIPVAIKSEAQNTCCTKKKTSSCVIVALCSQFSFLETFVMYLLMCQKGLH